MKAYKGVCDCLFIPIKEAKATGLVPEPWHYLFNDSCFCGSDNVISETRKTYKCSNPLCPTKTTGMIVGMLQKLGYKGWGEATISNYIWERDIVSICDFLRRPPNDLSDIIDVLNSFTLTYAQLVQIMCIPGLGTRCADIFKDCNSLQDLIHLAENKGTLVAVLRDRLGGNVLPHQIKDTIRDYYQDLSEVTNLVKTVPESQHVIKIAATGGITSVKDDSGRAPTREQFIRHLNNITRDAGIEFVQSSSYNSLSFVLADYPSSSAKYREGVSRNIVVPYNKLLRIAELMAETHRDRTAKLTETSERTNEFGGQEHASE